MADCTAETSATLLTLKRAGEDLEELKLEYRRTNITKTAENNALTQKTELLMHTHKVMTALEMLRVEEAAKQKVERTQEDGG